MSKHHLIRYLYAGSFIFLLNGLQFRIVYAVVPSGTMHAALAWAIHFLGGTLWTHAVHRWFTFRYTHQFPYWISLVRTFGANSAIWAAGTAMVWLLCDVGRLAPVAGWLTATIAAALLNYCVMRFFTIVNR